jgi:hypothetical protein
VYNVYKCKLVLFTFRFVNTITINWLLKSRPTRSLLLRAVSNISASRSKIFSTWPLGTGSILSSDKGASLLLKNYGAREKLSPLTPPPSVTRPCSYFHVCSYRYWIKSAFIDQTHLHDLKLFIFIFFIILWVTFWNPLQDLNININAFQLRAVQSWNN